MSNKTIMKSNFRTKCAVSCITNILIIGKRGSAPSPEKRLLNKFVAMAETVVAFRLNYFNLSLYMGTNLPKTRGCNKKKSGRSKGTYMHQCIDFYGIQSYTFVAVFSVSKDFIIVNLL